MAPSRRCFSLTAPLAKPTRSHVEIRPAHAVRQPLVEIGARHRITPLVQGELDTLCSLYAVINGLRLASFPNEPISMSQSRKLFACGVAYLHRLKGLGEALTEGLYTRRRLALARHLASIASSPRLQFVIERAGPDVQTMEDTYRWIMDSIFETQPVLIPLMGGLDHLSGLLPV